ncbi:MAG: thiamine phosphate synthase [Pseudomonadota bacterium]
MSTEETGARLYLITPALSAPSTFADALSAALDAAPVACVRLRTATEDEDMIRRIADQLREVCHPRDVALVLTDHFRLVSSLGIDGVHLANPRLSVRDARKALGEDAIIGAFGGASRHQGMTLGEAGADYVALGPVMANGLDDDKVAEPALFEWWAEMIETPSVAEGGMTLSLAEALSAHADFIAADSAVWDHAGGPGAGCAALAAVLV